jgi:hypothetical protein
MTSRFGVVGVLSIVATALMLFVPARAEVQCGGHEAFSTPRPAGSCKDVKPEIFVSPGQALEALVIPVDVSLYLTPDMESRVEIRASGDTLASQDHSSPRGMNGYYVVTAKWSPNSAFFAYSLTSSGGHQPWSFPIRVYSRKANAFAWFSDMVGGKPTVSGDFDFRGPHTLTARTWKKQGAFDDPVPITVDLEKAFAKLKPKAQ